MLASGCAQFQRKRRVRPPPTPAVAKKIKVAKEVKRKKPPPPHIAALNKLALSVGARHVKVDNPCVEGSEDNCFRRALDRLFVRLDTLAEAPRRSVRVLHLGDSHIAADYITGTVRERLQERFADGGRGFVHVEQRARYGGRRTKRYGRWRRSRIVDENQGGNPFGFSGMAIESRGAGAYVEYELEDDDRVTLFYHGTPKGALLSVEVDGQLIGRVDTTADKDVGLYKTFTIPRRRGEGTDSRTLRIQADGAGAKLFGLSFTENAKGLLYDSIGPVGADAKVYLSLERQSFTQHLKLLSPDLVIIMLGGNDALRIRKGDATPEQVRFEHEELVGAVQDALPEADCMLWSPMDAGEREGLKIVSKTMIAEVRSAQRDVARQMGCGFWDMYAAMGGEGSLARWFEANIINKDLIHPRRKAGELLGHLFATGLIETYDNVDE